LCFSLVVWNNYFLLHLICIQPKFDVTPLELLICFGSLYGSSFLYCRNPNYTTSKRNVSFLHANQHFIPFLLPAINNTGHIVSNKNDIKTKSINLNKKINLDPCIVSFCANVLSLFVSSTGSFGASKCSHQFPKELPKSLFALINLIKWCLR